MTRALALSLLLHLTVLGLAVVLWVVDVRSPTQTVELRLTPVQNAARAPSGQESSSSSESQRAKPQVVQPSRSQQDELPVRAVKHSENGLDDGGVVSLPSRSKGNELQIEALTPGPTLEQPALLGYPAPIYPRMARRLGWEGVVEVEVKVGENGKAVDAFIAQSSGHAALDEAAIASLRQAEFRPASRGGVPEEGTLSVNVRFRLE